MGPVNQPVSASLFPPWAASPGAEPALAAGRLELTSNGGSFAGIEVTEPIRGDWSAVFARFNLDPAEFVIADDTVRMSSWQSSKRTEDGDRDLIWLYSYSARFTRKQAESNVNLPALNEEYHVHWHRRRGGPEHLEWTTEIPLLAGDVTVGRLRIRGQPSEGSVCSWIGELVSGLRPFEAQMVSLVVEQFEESTRLESPTVSLVASSEAAV